MSGFGFAPKLTHSPSAFCLVCPLSGRAFKDTLIIHIALQINDRVGAKAIARPSSCPPTWPERHVNNQWLGKHRDHAVTASARI
jgi:hypothetical protein